MIAKSQEKIEQLEEFLKKPLTGKETQRALAVKLVLEVYLIEKYDVVYQSPQSY